VGRLPIEKLSECREMPEGLEPADGIADLAVLDMK
jgi:hypothetical protein